MYAIQRNTERPALIISTPQRRANPKNKNRLKWIDAKLMALETTHCVNTQEVRRWLNTLGVGGFLNLRMTSAWVAVRVDLAAAIKSEKTKEQHMAAAKVIQMSDYRKPLERSDRKITPVPQPQSDVDILLSAMKDAIASKNWEPLRRELLIRKKHKPEAWAMLTKAEQQHIENLVPHEIKILKAAQESGAITSFAEDEEGGIFWVWETSNAEPRLLSGTAVAKFLRSISNSQRQSS